MTSISKACVVSVIIPTYNRKELVKETILSVTQQSFTSWELIIVDDHSDEETISLLKEYEKSYSQIKVFSRVGERRNANVCRNQGLNHSSGEYILFLDSDDILQQDCLKERVSVMKSNAECDFMLFRAKHFEEIVGDISQQKAINTSTILDDLLEMNWVVQTSCFFYRRKTFTLLGSWNENLNKRQDWEYAIRALAMNLKYAVNNEKGFFYYRLRTKEKIANKEDRSFVSQETYKACMSILYATSIELSCEQKKKLVETFLAYYSKPSNVVHVFLFVLIDFNLDCTNAKSFISLVRKCFFSAVERAQLKFQKK